MKKYLFRLFGILLLIFLPSSKSNALSFKKILHSKTQKELESSLKKEETNLLLKTLCQKEKKLHKIPLSCYQMLPTSKQVDFWCLSLKVSKLDLSSIKQALNKSFLSLKCQDHLKEKQKLLIYRKKDFLLPELKKHWTDQSSLL
ncbi:MAG: hypothetical protein ACR2M7_05405 [Bdellovibrionales bacterium]